MVERYVGFTGEAYFTNAVTEIGGRGRRVGRPLRVAGAGSGRLPRRHDRTPTSSATAPSRRAVSRSADGSRGPPSPYGSAARAPGRALSGLYVVDGRQHVDNHVTVDHAVPRCSSQQLYKGVLDGASRAVFNGRIIVRPDAQKTDANQTNKHLLLSDGVEVDSKPQLEIFADDVRCTHGAAEGQLAPEALFYLRSRGLDEASARALLTYGFAREVVDGITVAADPGVPRARC